MEEPAATCCANAVVPDRLFSPVGVAAGLAGIKCTEAPVLINRVTSEQSVRTMSALPPLADNGRHKIAFVPMLQIFLRFLRTENEGPEPPGVTKSTVLPEPPVDAESVQPNVRTSLCPLWAKSGHRNSYGRSGSNATTRGKFTRISVNSPGFVSTSIAPPCCFTMMS